MLELELVVCKERSLPRFKDQKNLMILEQTLYSRGKVPRRLVFPFFDFRKKTVHGRIIEGQICLLARRVFPPPPPD